MRFAVVIAILAASAAYGLCPSEIAILVNADQPASVSIGTFYAISRGVPQSNIIPLRLGRGDARNISRKDYIEKVVMPVRERLGRESFSSIRCLLTTYLMPYRITAPAVDGDTLELVKGLEEVLAANKRIMFEAAAKLDPDFKPDASEIRIMIDKISRRIKGITDADERDKKIDEFTRVVMPLFGVFITAQMSQIEFDKAFIIPPEEFAKAVASREFIEKAVKENYSYAECLEIDYYSRYADVYGILDLVESLSQSIESLLGIEVSAALDSELALVKMPPYEWHKWQPNALRSDINDKSTLMVSRIDGPGEAICRGIIKKSIAAEKNTLRGSVCIDARYPAGEAPSEFAEYDNSMRRTAKMFDDLGWQVVLEETEALIKQDKPIKTAVYCGWYSLNNYVDAFDFVPGAVGYHIASLEARDIRDAKNGQWVSSMLAKGITVTLGAVDEPYLNAFPKPDEFFARLLEGRCIAEAFAMSSPYNSWQLILIADPLYRPIN